jgi:hypothetical protein
MPIADANLPGRATRRCGAVVARSLCRPADGSLPAEQEKVVPAKRAPVGLEEPLEGFLQGVPGADTSKVD